jgi:hypothetical protein
MALLVSFQVNDFISRLLLLCRPNDSSTSIGSTRAVMLTLLLTITLQSTNMRL